MWVYKGFDWCVCGWVHKYQSNQEWPYYKCYAYHSNNTSKFNATSNITIIHSYSYVCMHGVKLLTYSDWLSVRSGMPQGSVLGPLLFLLYIDDMHWVVKHSKLKLYADNVALYWEIKSETDCSRTLMVLWLGYWVATPFECL